jgi:hypothetical protein
VLPFMTGSGLRLTESLDPATPLALETRARCAAARQKSSTRCAAELGAAVVSR